MTPERRKEIEREVDRLGKVVAKREAAHEASRVAIEQLVFDGRSLFDDNPCGERLLTFLESYFCGAPDPRKLLKRSAEDAMKFTAKCEGNREVVEFLRKLGKGALKVHAA